VANHPDLDLILIDLIMPGMDGFDGIRALRDAAPGVPLVVVSVSEDREDIMQAVNLGALGYIPKTAQGEEIVKAIDLVLSGEVSGRSKGSVSPEARLTKRQKEIFNLLSEGLSNADIAGRLGLSVNTVRVHIHGILQRLQLDNRMQVVLQAAQRRQAGGGGARAR
jgi:DNA-binding NarL/FixJ family response regulator